LSRVLSAEDALLVKHDRPLYWSPRPC